ncbi:ATP-binding protein [Intestinimonas massiliensis (ex Afouda et al. 2020)]|uniref:ATP-binding protein n=1 Tax=Intestinimonas massiliensis (ex Afouda et al. 2020) TaxID=1673721 RepID=UPI00102F7C07|nr:AAA family ATPase [Intestinimonas massiliensis (ex Afouda et al. 2020)]
MKIKKMRATFGGLDHRELTLKDGLNIITAPNEGGKSTWSAFLRAMFYGINTKERDKQNYIAEKNRYQPWSGAAMEGVLDLEWKGQAITLRRGQKGNTPFGAFEAVYTGTGEQVPGLTGDTVGETLLGVPREVFERSAFVGQGGTAIDGAPALEARIAALASSGEEDVSYSQVERVLRDWRNRRQHNRTGLIPKLEGELAEIENTLARQSKAFRLSQEAKRELDRLQTEHKLLLSERQAHLVRAMAARRQKWEAGQQALAETRAQVEALQAELNRYGAPPDGETLRRAQEELNYLNTLHSNQKLAENQLEEARTEEAETKAAAVDPLFPDLTPDEAWQQASADAETVGRAVRTGGLTGGGAAALVLAAAALGLALAKVLPALWMGAAACGVLAAAGVGLLVAAAAKKKGAERARADVLERYSANTPDDILTRANVYRERCVVAAEAARRREAVEQSLAELTARDQDTKTKLLALVHTFAPTVTDTFGVSAAISRALNLDQRLATAKVKLEGARTLADSLPKPEDGLEDNGVVPRFDPAETAARLEAAESELTRLRGGLALAQGELNTLGDREELTARREAVVEELERRRKEYDALTAALEALEKGHAGLQARFSPALNRRAGELLSKLTGGKYDKVSLTREFEALAEEHDGLLPRRALVLSRGTADQLYLAVRLAVCQLVLPGEDPCPLVLDDALANFDDERMALALDTLAELGQERQILLFTCHSRESAWLAEK